MAHVLLVGYDPKTEDDFSAPDRPAGETEESIQAGIDRGVKQMRERGLTVDVLMIDARQPVSDVGPTVERQLRSAHYGCVVIGGGIRRSKNYLTLEAVLNAVHAAAPGAAFALNMGPQNSAEAVARWLTS